jgi:hypothetical protein
MPESIFSTYRTGENRVTSSILAVLRSLALSRMERLLGSMMEAAEFQLVRFKNQPKSDLAIPDAEIAANCQILIETKIQRGAVDHEQLARHLKCFREGKATQVLLVLSPDDTQPAAIDRMQDPRVVWTSFTSLNQAVEELLMDPAEVVSEREAFLLRELQAMLLEEHLLGSEKNVVVVAARRAWEEYLSLGAYVCQANRAFQPVEYLAFYKSGQICPRIPRIVEVVDPVELVSGKYDGRLATVVEEVLRRQIRAEGASQKVFLLSGPEEPTTKQLDRPLKNTLQSASGQPTAFTQSQRYVRLDDLLKATTTADLV